MIELLCSVGVFLSFSVGFFIGRFITTLKADRLLTEQATEYEKLLQPLEAQAKEYSELTKPTMVA